jgi:hypothetical protein
MAITYTYIPFGRKIDKIALQIPHLPLQGLPKITQIGLFGLIILHLATLAKTTGK